MSERQWGVLYVGLTILLSVYGQLALKWRIGAQGGLPEPLGQKIVFLLVLFLDPVIFSVFVAGLVASLAWMAALTKMELSLAYPFMSLNFVLVLLLSGWLLGERVTAEKLIGVALIVAGTIVTSRG